MNKRIVIIGDSLSQIRFLENIQLENIYQYFLQNSLNNTYVVNYGVPSNTSRICSSTSAINNHILATNANFYIIQLGIVDCAPRIFNKYEKKIFEFLTFFPFVGKIVQKFVSYLGKKRKFLTKVRKNVMVEIDEFEKNLKKIIDNINKTSNCEKVFFINIAYPSLTVQNEYTNILDNIDKYNEIFNKLKKDYENIYIIDLYEFTKSNQDALLADGMHINEVGHSFIAKEILSLIENKE